LLTRRLFVVPILAAALAVFAARMARPVVRVVVAHAVALGAAACLLASVEDLLPSAAALGVASLGLVLGTVVGRFSGRAGAVAKLAGCLVVLGALPWQVNAEGRPNAVPWSDGSDIETFAAARARERDATAWHVFPPWDLDVLRFDFDAKGVKTSSSPAATFVAGPTSYAGTNDLDLPPPGRLVVFSCERKPMSCRPAGGSRCATVYDCP
jgi:hypothetical protein